MGDLDLSRRVDSLELAVRTLNCLQSADIEHIGDLVRKTEAELIQLENFGPKSLKEIKEILSDMGLGLGMKLEGWHPRELAKVTTR